MSRITKPKKTRLETNHSIQSKKTKGSKNLKATRKKTKIQIIKQACGMDMSKDSFVVCYLVEDSDGNQILRGRKKFNNTPKGFIAFWAWISKKKISDLPLVFLLEATGVYHEALTYFLHDQSCEIKVILPNQSKAFGKSLNVKTKNDDIDSKTLAIMALERPHLRSWKPASPKMRTLKKLSRERTQLVKEKSAIKNQLHAEKHSYKTESGIVDRYKQRINFIEQQIKEIEKQLMKLVKEYDPKLLSKIENICELDGVGFITVITLIAETNGFELFTSIRQLISYSGYDVVENQSGNFNGKTKISKMGNKYIRRALHMPSLAVVRCNPDSPFAKQYERVFERTKIKRKGYVAVQRRMLILIYTLFKKDQAYNADFHRQACETKKLQAA